MKNIVESLNLLASTATRQVDMLVNQGLIKTGVNKMEKNPFLGIFILK